MKRIATLLYIVFMCLNTTVAMADAYYNISELRQQTPVNLTRSYETKWGTLEINVPIVLPDVPKLPAIAYRCVPDYKIDFPPETTFSQCVEYNNILFQVNMDSTFPTVPKGYGVSTKPYDGEIAENNDFLPTEATQFAEELIRKYTPLEPGVDTTSLVPHATSAYYLYDWKTGIFVDDLPPLSDPGFDKGSYAFDLQQVFHGITMENKGGYFSFSGAPLADTRPPYPQLHIDIINKEQYSFEIILCEEVETLASDLPLVGFDKVWKSIEQYIDTGHIRQVKSIELSALTGFVPPDGSASNIYWAVPNWTVEVVWCHNPSKDIHDVGEIALHIDAQTGEIPDINSTEKTRLRYHELITWDQIQ